VPGGWAPDKLRRYPAVTGLVRRFYEQGKIVGLICHAGLVGISAGIVKGHRATGSLGIKIAKSMNISLRNFRIDDVPALSSLWTAVEDMEHLGLATTEEDIRARHLSPTLDAEQNSFVAVAPDGQIVGNAWVTVRHGIGEDTFNVNGMVHPAWRGQGIGQQLMDAIIARARARLSEAASSNLWLQSADIHVAPNDGGRIALFESNGFEAARWAIDMRRELPGLGKVAPVIPIAQEPPGIQFRKWRPGGDDEAVGWMLDGAFHDSWGYSQIIMAEWLRYVQAGFVALEHSVLAWSKEGADDRLVGACVNLCDERVFKARGRNELYVADLAVLRDGAASAARRQRCSRGRSTAPITWECNRWDSTPTPKTSPGPSAFTSGWGSR